MYELTMHSAAAMAQTQDATQTTVEELVREHGRLVFRICWAVSRNHHDAEDASQEVFLRVLRHERELAQIEDPKAWLARIAWRVAIDRLPKKVEAALSDEELVAKMAELRAAETSAEDAAANAQLQQMLARVIQSLPEELRAPLLLGGLHELSSREVAKALQIPETTVRVRQMRARQLLKEKLEQLGGGR
jgi:RNA polymerase sigma-70 factor (ECF subfamily)